MSDQVFLVKMKENGITIPVNWGPWSFDKTPELIQHMGENDGIDFSEVDAEFDVKTSNYSVYSEESFRSQWNGEKVLIYWFSGWACFGGGFLFPEGFDYSKLKFFHT